MDRTKIASQVLLVLSLAARGEWGERECRRLVLRAEQIARGRRSHVLGVRHLVLAAAKLGMLGTPADCPGDRAGWEARPDLDDAGDELPIRGGR